MSEPLDFESRDTPFLVAVAGMIGIAKALFEGSFGVLGIAVASSVDDSFGAGALVFGILYLLLGRDSSREFFGLGARASR